MAKRISEMLTASTPLNAHHAGEARQKFINSSSRPTGQRIKGRYVRKSNIRENEESDLGKTETGKKSKKDTEQININPDKAEILKGQLN